MSDDRATYVTDFEGDGWIIVLDADSDPTDAADEFNEKAGGRERVLRVVGVSFEYAPERTHAPLVVREEDAAAAKTQLRPADVSKAGVEGTEEYRMRGVGLLVDTAFRHPDNASLRFKVVSN
jgi:hypothetical protein